MDTFSASVPDPHDEVIAALNDKFRQMGEGGHVFLTRGVSALGEAMITAAREAVRTYDAFTPENDPYGEHDFGSFKIEEYRFFWKIDAYDPPESYGDDDSWRPTRLLTIMLAEEY